MHPTGFSAARDGPKLAAEVTHNLTRPTAWEAVMRIRCSKGLRIASFHGHFFNRWVASGRPVAGARALLVLWLVESCTCMAPCARSHKMVAHFLQIMPACTEQTD